MTVVRSQIIQDGGLRSIPSERIDAPWRSGDIRRLAGLNGLPGAAACGFQPKRRTAFAVARAVRSKVRTGSGHSATRSQCRVQ